MKSGKLCCSAVALVAVAFSVQAQELVTVNVTNKLTGQVTQFTVNRPPPPQDAPKPDVNALQAARQSALARSSVSMQTMELADTLFESSLESESPPGNQALMAPETPLFDTTGAGGGAFLPSWRDTRTSPVPDGTALGIVIATNTPFEITRIDAEVVFDTPLVLTDTEIEVGFFRGTNELQFGMFLEPEFKASDVEETLTKTLTDLGNGHWTLSVQVPTYAWGAARVLTIRTVPNGEGAMSHMSLVASGATVPGVTAYSSDNTTSNMVQVALPKMAVWRRMLDTTREVNYRLAGTDFEVNFVPGYEMGVTTNMPALFDWQADTLQAGQAVFDSRESMRFFLLRPDTNN